MKNADITPEMTIEDLLSRYPQAAKFFLRFGIRCFTCSGIIWGTVRETLRRKGIQDIDAEVEQLNEYLNENINN